MMKKFITKILIWEAKILLKRFEPQIIGVTGSVGKTSSKEAIACVLERKFTLRKSIKSYNSELGLALAILGLETAWKSPVGWMKNVLKGIKMLFGQNFPQVLVLEMGVDRPKDMDGLLKIVRPNIGVVTAMGEIPVHVEYFTDIQSVAREKAKLIKSLGRESTAILNIDDDIVWDMKGDAKGEVVSFGLGDNARIRALNCSLSEAGTMCKVDFNGSSVPLKAHKVFGMQHIYAMLSAIAVGSVFEMNLIEMVEALSLYKPPPGRLQLIGGIKGSQILDDTYNASPLATSAALDVLQELSGKRKIFVFGDMLELGKYSISAHKDIGRQVARIADIVITVGPRTKFTSEEAGIASDGRIKEENFSTSIEAAHFLKDIIKEGDLVLVKGSQSMRMERVVEGVMARPEDAPKLLARQDKYWQNKK